MDTKELGITFRPATSDDEEVLFELFCSAHAHKFAQLGLPNEQLKPLLLVQFNGQRQDFRQNYPDADFDLVIKNGGVIGQFFVLRQPEQFTVIDITFLPEHRTGLATKLVRSINKEAQAKGVPIHAHVEIGNPAWNLWKRLGYRRVGGNEIYWTLEYPAPPSIPGTSHEPADFAPSGPQQ